MSLQDFTEAYEICALWSTTGDDEQPLDANYGIDDIVPSFRRDMAKDCADFYAANAATWQALDNFDDSQAGHDFWLTRNRHGAGFWDRGIGAAGDALTAAAHAYGSVDIILMKREADMLLYLSDARGRYIPRDFALETKRECISGVKQEDLDILAAGPDHEWYWDAWETVCNNATLASPENGKQYFIWQDGDCWLIEKGAECDDITGEWYICE